MKRALQVVLAISLMGVVFSGTLSYRELFAGAPSCSAAAGATGMVFGLPACVFGLVMYLLLTAVAAIGLYSERSRAGHHGVGDAHAGA